MTKHLGYSLIGALLFLSSTLLLLSILDPKGIHGGVWDALSKSQLLKTIVKTSFWIGALTGSFSSIAMRKSVNGKIYIWVIMLVVLVFTEFVISTLVL